MLVEWLRVQDLLDEKAKCIGTVRRRQDMIGIAVSNRATRSELDQEDLVRDRLPPVSFRSVQRSCKPDRSRADSMGFESSEMAGI